jgi:MFS transporter, DHA2 family, multidrug resistance protein
VSANRRWWALGALALSLLVIGFDATILHVALPNLAAALRASTSQLQPSGAGH